MQARLQSCPAARNPTGAINRRSQRSLMMLQSLDGPVSPAAQIPSPGVSQRATFASIDTGLAHDAANLLGAIGLYCDLLDQPGTLQPQHRHYAAELRQLSQRGASLMRQLLPEIAAGGGNPIWAGRDPQASSFAQRTAAPQTSLQRASVSPFAALRALEPLLLRIAGPAIEIVVDMPQVAGDGEFVLAHQRHAVLDPEALERIVLNLVLNAVQALQRAFIKRTEQASGEKASGVAERPPVGARIQVSLRRARHLADSQLCLSVSDNGPGLSADAARKLLDPDATLSTACRGHGHRIVQQLAHATGGILAVRSRAGCGTTITVRWPLPAREGIRSANPSLFPAPFPSETSQERTHVC